MTEIKKAGNDAKYAYLKDNYGKNILPLSIFENKDYPGSRPTELLIFYKKKASLSEARESLFKTIEHYNLFSSRLIMIDENKYALQYCREGFEYHVLPSIDVASDEINIDDVKNKIKHVQTLPGEPLFAITLIPIKDGILGGLSCSHAVGDVTSLMLFMFAWGCMHYGHDFPMPSNQRLFKGEPVRFETIDRAFIPPLSELNDEIQNRVKKTSDWKTYYKRESFTETLLEGMKNKAKSENENYVISNNQIINSILLKKYHEEIMPDTDNVRLRIPVNLRYIHPDIDASYIGNAVFSSVVEFEKNEIKKMSEYQIAYRIKQSIARMRNENYVKKIAYLSEYGIEYQGDIFKTLPPYNINTDILSANLTHVNDLESLGLGSDIGNIIFMSSTMQTIFTMLKEKKGMIFVEIQSRYPFKA